MPPNRGSADEHRRNLAELDPVLRDRILGLDEPVARSDWGVVVRRSRVLRLASRRSLVVALVAASASLLAATWGLGDALTGAGPARSTTAPLRLALRLTDGSGVVLYSKARHAPFVDNSDGRARGRSSSDAEVTAPLAAAGIRHMLGGGGPFDLEAAVVRSAVQPAGGPLPGDQALLSLNLYTTARLERGAGSAVLTCEYGMHDNAYCDAVVHLEDGSRLMASGMLNPDASHATLVVTGGVDRTGTSRGVARGPREITA